MSWLFACSGPGAADAMWRATLVGWGALALSLVAVATTAAASKHHRSWLVRAALGLSAVLLLVHPGLWLGTTSGDCGAVRFVASLCVAGVHALLAVPAVVLSRRA